MIGILSGAGPLAGVDVAKKLIEETQAITDQEHLPFMLSSIPAKIPDRTQFLLHKNGENPGIGIAELFLHLEKSGVTVAALACNTAHAEPIYKEFLIRLSLANSQLKILHIVQETVIFMADRLPQGASIGVLSTTGTRNLALYKDALIEKDFQVIEPTEEEQIQVQEAIFNTQYGIKAQSSPVHPQAVENLQKTMRILKNRGAEVFLLGCTELPLAIEFSKYLDCEIIDPNRILARALIKNYQPEKLKY